MEIFNQDILALIEENSFLIAVLLVWSLAWKGVAMWKAARLSHKWWFVIILLANTIGVLEIIYIFFVAKNYIVESEEKTDK
jgi:hypothetical protein